MNTSVPRVHQAYLLSLAVVIKWCGCRLLSQIPGGLVEAKEGKLQLPQAAVGALAAAIFLRSRDPERALAVLAAILPVPEPPQGSR